MVPIENIYDAATGGPNSGNFTNSQEETTYAFIESDNMITVTKDYPNGDAEIIVVIDGAIQSSSYLNRDLSQIIRTDYTTNQATVTKIDRPEIAEANIERSSYAINFTTLGNIRYQYAAGSTYKLCGAQIKFATDTNNLGQFNLSGYYKDKAAVVLFIANLLTLPAAISETVVGIAITAIGLAADAIDIIFPDYYLSCITTTNVWRVTDTSNSYNFDQFQGNSYYIVQDGRHAGSTYTDGVYYAKSAFTGKNTQFAYFVYGLLFSYNIFDIYDWQ